MRLIECHIENFGRIRALDHRFEEGVNVICRENGWGKTTFAAFLLAMLYGFPSTRRKKAEDNDRDRFRPWQGGIYGGRLSFEAGGKIYEITRSFGKRESEDEFELRDLETNLVSHDFSQKTGEDLFHLDRESFARTVFTGQQDCACSMTDKITALIAGLTDQAGDMGSYEAAMKRLAEAANRLTPARASGSLSRRAQEIRTLEREAAGREELTARILACSRKEETAAARERRLQREVEELEAGAASARAREEEQERSRDRERAWEGARRVRRQLLASRDLRQRELEAASAFFPGRTPSCGEVDRYLKTCRELDRMEAKIQAGALTEEEQIRLNMLEETIGARGKAGRSETGGAPDGAAGTKGPVCILAGIVLFAAGLAGFFPARSVLFACLSAAGLAVAAGGAILLSREKRERLRESAKKARRESRTGKNSPAPGNLTASEQGQAEAEAGGRTGEYEYLLQKEARLEALYAEWSQTRRPVIRFLRELGFAPREDLADQLQSIRAAADACEDAGKLLRAAERDLIACEREMQRLGISLESADEAEMHRADAGLEPANKTGEQRTGPDPAGKIQRMAAGFDSAEKTETYRTGSGSDPAGAKGTGENSRPAPEGSGAALERLAEDKREELDRCRESRRSLMEELEELRAELEDREKAWSRLELLKEEQAADQTRFRQIRAAAENLRRAREALTARYRDPLTDHFHRYWETITGYSAAGTSVDADAGVTVEERGKQRDSALLSRGYRDLAGICLRAALADAMYPADLSERPPLILDDPFSNLDDEKMEGALHFLEEMGKTYQVIYFTCSRARC
ncbi:MAG: hypothetical protein E7238_10010 [Sarcina sp.]|nr:hypothetical protein [Sarcina sp.]